MEEKSKKIAQNTFFLYFRTILLMFISFYTSRVILDKLGVEDYGLYNVVSSIAATFTFFSSQLTNATQRFITIELGKDDLVNCNRIFNQHLIVYVIISLLVVIIAEIVGVWFIEQKLNAASDRILAAHVTFQIAIFTLIIGLISIVFESLIIAHEDMKVYSYLSVVEGVLKLLVVYLLVVMPFDKLILFAALMALVGAGCKFYFAYYSFSHYQECSLKWYWNYSLVRKTFSFVGWNMVGGMQASLTDQGVNILLNMYYGPVVNAARGITVQVSGALFRLSSNILIAVQPQMVKSYARGDKDYVEMLFYNSSRFSFLALWVLICPFYFCIDGVLDIWLKEVPEWTIQFVQLAFIGGLIYILTRPIWTLVLADGRIRNYMLISSAVSVLVFPSSYVFLEMGYSPLAVYYCSIIVNVLGTAVQLKVLKSYLNYSTKGYAVKVLLPIVEVVLLSTLLAFVISSMAEHNVLGTFILISTIFVEVCVVTFYLGLRAEERHMIINKMKNIKK